MIETYLVRKKNSNFGNKKLPEKNAIPVQTRGRDFNFVPQLHDLIKCIPESGIYEIQDPTLKIMIKQILGLLLNQSFDVLFIDMYMY